MKVFKGVDETSSVASSGVMGEDIDNMKKQLARLQEMQMDASEADKKALSQQIREVKR